MSRFIYIIILACISFNPAFSQKCTYAEGMSRASKRSMLSYTTPATENDRTGLIQAIEQIKQVIKLNADFDVYQYNDEMNCYAQKQGNKLVFNVQFLKWANSQSGTRWAAISILAHEIGHHISGFVGSEHRKELDADYWSGYILQKLGAGKSAAIKAMSAIGHEQDSQSHPNKYSRIDAIEKGWDDAYNRTPDFSHGGR